MKLEGPLDIRPLTLRGTFGIAWKLVRRNFGALLLYGFLMWLIVLLGALIVVSPVLGSIIKGDFAGVDFAVGTIIAVLLLFVYMGAVTFVFKPIYLGTLYGEFSARMYAHGASCKMLLKRSIHSLKRFFTTALCLMLCGIIISIAQSVLLSIVGGIVGIMGTFSLLQVLASTAMWDALAGSFLASLGGGAMAIGLIIGSLGTVVTLAGQSFLCLTYPAAVNENVRNFDAVGRSFKFAGGRFGRVFGTRLLFRACLTVVSLLLFGVAYSTVATQTVAENVYFNSAPSWLTYAGIFAVLLVRFFGELFAPALDTVLYYDARVRLEGRAWLGIDAPVAAPEAPQAEQTEPTTAYQNDDHNGGNDGT